MAQLSESITQKPITALFYSHSGFGKTTLWGRMAKHSEFYPIYCLDFDLRIAALRTILSADEMKNIYFDEFRDDKYQGDAAVEAMKIADNIELIDKKYGVVFKTVIVDSGTFWMRNAMSRVLFLDGAKPATFTPQRQHYMAQISMTEEFVSKLCGLSRVGRNFIFTCHEKNNKDEVTGRLFKTVDLTGEKSPDRIPGYFNEFWHCEVRQSAGKEPEFVVRTRSDVIYSARTSFGFLESVEKQEEIWNKIVKNSVSNKK